MEKLSATRCEDLEYKNTRDLAGIFRSRCDLNRRKLYILRFQRIPNQVGLDGIDYQKANKWIMQNYQDRIKDCFYKKCYRKRKGMIFIETFYFLFDDLMIYLDDDSDEARFLYRKTDAALVNEIVCEIRKFKIKKRFRKQPEIELLVNCGSGLGTQTMKISSPKFCIEDNYNDDFLTVHETILNRISKKNDKGLILLHGKPGTGKTSYIRHLITKITKPVIFLPPNIAASITDPGLMSVLISYPNSVFVIEDAENIIIDRNCDGASPVSALLNLADGLLSDCLNIQIICSFNTDLSRVDSALTRKGRLIAKYEFSELDVDKAQALSNKLGFKSVIDSPMTLAAVYNQNDKEFVAPTKKKTPGFSVAA